MPDITNSVVSELADPKIRALAKRALRELQLETEKAVAHHAEPAKFPLAADATSVEQIMLARFKELTPTKQQAAVVKTLASVNAPDAQRKLFFGDLAGVNLKSATSVRAQAQDLPFPATLKFNLNQLTSIALLSGNILGPAGPGGLTPQQTTTNKVELRIHKVRCVDETNPEFFGDDEISLGGTTVDESGDTGKVAPFVVRNDFDDGEQKVYSPPKRFTFFSLTEGTTFPKSYFATLVLAEVDMGGFNNFLTKLWEKVKGKVMELILSAIGGAIGSTIPGLGTIVGAAVGWVIAKFIEWLIGLFGDDVFPPVTVSVNIPSLSARWPGNKTDSPEGVITYTGYGGKYQVTYDWRLFA